MRIYKSIFIMLMISGFVFTISDTVSAQKEPREVVHEGYKIVINDEYLKELPQDELTEMLDTILPLQHKNEPRVIVHNGYKVVINDEHLKGLSQDELTEMLDTILDEYH